MSTGTQELTVSEQMGDIEEEKVFHHPQLGEWIFRLPYVGDEMAVLRRRAQLVGIGESLAGQELITTAHARAMLETYAVRKPHNFDFDKQRSWQYILELAADLGNWHQAFFRSMGGDQISSSSS